LKKYIIVIKGDKERLDDVNEDTIKVKEYLTQINKESTKTSTTVSDALEIPTEELARGLLAYIKSRYTEKDKNWGVLEIAITKIIIA
jgi:hypothetical protein